MHVLLPGPCLGCLIVVLTEYGPYCAYPIPAHTQPTNPISILSHAPAGGPAGPSKHISLWHNLILLSFKVLDGNPVPWVARGSTSSLPTSPAARWADLFTRQ